MAGFTKTLIRLRDDRMHELRARAAREGKTLVGVVREAVDLYLGRTDASAGDPMTHVEDPFDAFVGSVRSGVTDGSLNHDHYLYGSPKEDAGRAPVRRHKRARRARRSE